VSVSQSYEDIVIFEVDGTRLSLAYCDVTREPDAGAVADDVAAVLVISIGNDPSGTVAGALFDNRYQICGGLVEKVEGRHRSDMTIWIEEPGMFNEDVFDGILDDILCRPKQPPAPDVFPHPVAADVIVATHPVLYADGEPLSRTQHKHPQTMEMERLRSALYAKDARPDRQGASPDRLRPRDMPLPHRLTIYTINATLMVVALPIGAAVMTYCALGRESLSVAARAMALTGAAIGVGQLEAVRNLLSLVG
jgi:hypothetical protein